MLKPIVSAKAKCFLLKTEPHVFSVDNLDSLPNKIGQWIGIRNGQAKNNLKKAEIGDLCFIYHSSCGSNVAFVGLAKVVKTAYSDPSAYDKSSNYYDAREVAKFGSPISDNDAKWKCIDVQLISKYEIPLLLSKLKQLIDDSSNVLSKDLKETIKGMTLFRNTRLSVHEVKLEEFHAIYEVLSVIGNANSSTSSNKRSIHADAVIGDNADQTKQSDRKKAKK